MGESARHDEDAPSSSLISEELPQPPSTWVSTNRGWWVAVALLGIFISLVVLSSSPEGERARVLPGATTGGGVGVTPPPTGRGGGGGGFSWSLLGGRDRGETTSVRKRYLEVREHFEAMLKEKDEATGGNWTLISSSHEGRLKVWMRWPDSEPTAPGAFSLLSDGSTTLLPGVPLILAEGAYQVPASQLWEAMRIRNQAQTQPLIDPFFEGYRTVKSFKDDPSIELGIRSTKRLLVYGKRDFAFACVEDKLTPPPPPPRGGGARGRRAIPPSYLTAVLSLPDHPLLPESPGYTRAYQDMVSFFFDQHHEGQGPSSRAVMVMRTDLRGNIPLWLFTKSCGHTGLHVLQTLHRITETK